MHIFMFCKANSAYCSHPKQTTFLHGLCVPSVALQLRVSKEELAIPDHMEVGQRENKGVGWGRHHF